MSSSDSPVPIPGEQTGEAVVAVVEEGDEVVIVVAPGPRLLCRPVSYVHALKTDR